MTSIKIAERLATLETDVKYIKEEIDVFISQVDKRYASKLTERIVYALCGIILVAFIAKLLNQW